MKSKHYARQLLDQVVQLDHQTSRAYYDMGKLLVAIRDSQLYELLDYPTFNAMIEAELSFSTNTASKYACMYDHFRRLKYSKIEALQLITNCGYTKLSKILPSLDTKLGVRAIKNRVDSIDEHQINFTFTTAEYQIVIQALKQHGAYQDSQSKRYANISIALLDLITNTTRKKAA